MVKEFSDKREWALILGGSSGLGLATAKKLAKHGMNICVVHRNSRSQLSQLEKEFHKITQEGVGFVRYNTDALHSEKRIALLEDLRIKMKKGKLKILVHSIARGNLKPMVADSESELRSDDFLLTIQAMGISLYDWTQILFKAKLFSQDARVISFTSQGNSKAWKSYAAVSAAKSTLEAITRNIALEFAPFGIKANCIQAGITDTASFRKIQGSNEIKKHSLMQNPFKRLTVPEDIANAVYLLSKDEASWINGAIIPVDGGEHFL